MFDPFPLADLTPSQKVSLEKIEAACPKGRVISKNGRPVYRWEDSKKIFEVDLTDSSSVVTMT